MKVEVDEIVLRLLAEWAEDTHATQNEKLCNAASLALLAIKEQTAPGYCAHTARTRYWLDDGGDSGLWCRQCGHRLCPTCANGQWHGEGPCTTCEGRGVANIIGRENARRALLDHIRNPPSLTVRELWYRDLLNAVVTLYEENQRLFDLTFKATRLAARP